ncbi:MAG: TIM-barrel domain-containing protein [Chitinophagaceae bacterium]
MPNFLRVLICILFAWPVATYGAPTPPDPRFSKTNDGVIIYPDENFSGHTRAIRLQIISENIIRVLASPQKEFPVQNSLITVYKTGKLPEWTLISENDKENITLKTKLITAVANLITGTVIFHDAAGKVILGERKMGRSFNETVFEGERTYGINQSFETSADDAWYGLGQHHDGLMNYKGNQVFLFQDNTEVAVPFLVSNKNYGILWDNYSITRAGDTRDYKKLSSLKLFSKDGQPGYLTATYCNDKDKPNVVLMQKAESDISYEYLNDSKLFLPASFTTATGVLTWEGSIASDLNGIHKLRLTYGGYLKVWINGKLLADRWRQAWKPGSIILDVAFEAQKKIPVKIEWIPDGGESYVSLKYMEPAGDKNADVMGFASEAGKQMDYYFIYGNNMDEVIGGYRTLTGSATMLPIWAFGFWQSRERYKTQDEVLNTVKEFRKRKIPLDNIVLDWSYWKQDAWGSQEFEKSRFPAPDSMIKVLHDQYHTRFMISVWPKFYEGIEAYNDFDKKGWLYKRNIANRQRDWIAQGYVSTFYDAFNEKAQKGFWDLINTKLYKKGVDAWWLDASEPDILSNATPQQRKDQMYPLSAGNTSEYLNAYPLVNAKGIYEGQRSADPDKRVFILTRSAFPGIQRYAAGTWSGDISSRWHDMTLQISAGVNFSMSGLPYWGMDIGGFAVESRYEKPNSADLEEWRELNARWYQFGSFVPLFRVHGQFPYREIYNVSPEDHACYKSMMYYAKLRYRLLPYIYSLAGSVYHKGYTMMRGLAMDFAADNVVTNIADQYMFGPSLLINPVYNYKARSRSVYLPKGQGWYDLYTGAFHVGGQTIIADAAYEKMPVFVKAGSILPFGPALQYTTEKKADTISLYIYGGKDGSFSLYEDEGLNYNYEKGVFSTIQFSYSEKDKKLTIGKREGKFPGMLDKRYFRVKYITENSAGALTLDKTEGTLIRYNGSEQMLRLR